MKNRLDEELERWESGEISLSELASRHPDQEVEGLAALFSRLELLSEESVPDPDEGWQSLRLLLPDCPLGLAETFRRGWRRRVLVALVAAILAVPAAALAATQSFREAVGGVVAKVVQFVTGESPHGSGSEPGDENLLSDPQSEDEEEDESREPDDEAEEVDDDDTEEREEDETEERDNETEERDDDS